MTKTPRTFTAAIGLAALTWGLATAAGQSVATEGDEGQTPAKVSKPILAASQAVRDRIAWTSADGCKHIHGFNYQPSWGANGVEIWGEAFDANRFREELRNGKRCFPGFNTVRIWLSWSAYRADPSGFIVKFRQAIDICGELDLLVMPILFSRWPGWDRVSDSEIEADCDPTFGNYIRALVAPMRGDLRILAWDLCNEPFNDTTTTDTELRWLTAIHQIVKQSDGEARTCIGMVPGVESITRSAHLQDIITPHLYVPLYAFPEPESPVTRVPASCIAESFELAKQLQKPILATECCWGSDDDNRRADIVRENLGLLKQYGTGFLAHALYTSGVPDLHKDKACLYMPFLLNDGSLRPGHDVYNEFAR